MGKQVRSVTKLSVLIQLLVFLPPEVDKCMCVMAQGSTTHIVVFIERTNGIESYIIGLVTRHQPVIGLVTRHQPVIGLVTCPWMSKESAWIAVYRRLGCGQQQIARRGTETQGSVGRIEPHELLEKSQGRQNEEDQNMSHCVVSDIDKDSVSFTSASQSKKKTPDEHFQVRTKSSNKTVNETQTILLLTYNQCQVTERQLKHSRKANRPQSACSSTMSVKLPLRSSVNDLGRQTNFILVRRQFKQKGRAYPLSHNVGNRCRRRCETIEENVFRQGEHLKSRLRVFCDSNTAVNFLCELMEFANKPVFNSGFQRVVSKLTVVLWGPYVGIATKTYFSILGVFAQGSVAAYKNIEAANLGNISLQSGGCVSNEEWCIHEKQEHTLHTPRATLGQFVLIIIVLFILALASNVRDNVFDYSSQAEKHEFPRMLFFGKQLRPQRDESCLKRAERGTRLNPAARSLHSPSRRTSSELEHETLFCRITKTEDWHIPHIFSDLLSVPFSSDGLKKYSVLPERLRAGVKPDRSHIPAGSASFLAWPLHRFLPDALSSPEQDMACAGYRLATLGALPASCHVSRLKLADAGFYYRGESDEVVCYSCRARHRGWSSSDDPLSVHRRLSPGCCHLTQVAEAAPGHKARNHGDAGAAGGDASDAASGTGALVNGSGPDHSEDGEPRLTNAGHATSADEADRSSSLASASSSTTSHNAAADVADLRSEPSGGHLARGMFPTPKLDLGGAVYPMYQDMASRRKSFARWDQARAPRLDDILLNGMFYAGYADCVRCFYCGVGLKSWQPTDDVWSEHIRWRPDCQFLRTVKGDDYIRRVTARLNRETASDPDSTDTVSSVKNSDHSSLTPTRAAAANPPSSQASATSVATTASTTTIGNPTLSMSPHTDSLHTSTGSAPTQTLTNPSETSSETDTTARPPAVSSNDCRDETNDPRSQGSGISVVPPNEESESERLTRLRRENRELAGRMQCRVCNGRPIDTIFLPCGHLLACEVCTATLRECPLCREYIQATARVHMG